MQSVFQQPDDRTGSGPAMLTSPPPRIVMHTGQVVMYQITDQELEYFASGQRSLFAGLTSACASIAISVGVPLALSGNIDRGLEIGMWCAVAMALGVGLLSGILWVKESLSYRQKLKDFKEKQNRVH